MKIWRAIKFNAKSDRNSQMTHGAILKATKGHKDLLQAVAEICKHLVLTKSQTEKVLNDIAEDNQEAWGVSDDKKGEWVTTQAANLRAHVESGAA